MEEDWFNSWAGIKAFPEAGDAGESPFHIHFRAVFIFACPFGSRLWPPTGGLELRGLENGCEAESKHRNVIFVGGLSQQTDSVKLGNYFSSCAEP